MKIKANISHPKMPDIAQDYEIDVQVSSPEVTLLAARLLAPREDHTTPYKSVTVEIVTGHLITYTRAED